MDSASRSPEPFNIPAVTDMGDDTFSPLLVQRRFAGVCPDVQVIPLPRGATTVVQLSSFLPVAMVGQIYAPGPVAGCRTMIAYISMTRDDAGTGTTVRTDWSCAIRLRPGSDSGALDGLFLPYDMKELFSTDEFSRHRIALRDVVKLCSGVRP
jgi:hypothetical protein